MRWLSLVLAGALLVGSGCRRVPPPVEALGTVLDSFELPGSVTDGRRTYERACASCHGPDGRGGGAVASSFSAPPPDLTRLAASHGGTFPRDEVIAVITGARDVPAHGTPDMPVWTVRFAGPPGASAAAALYARRRVELLADYLVSIQVPADASPPS
jgi:mono/diheme cytochrome c family protein